MTMQDIIKKFASREVHADIVSANWYTVAAAALAAASAGSDVPLLYQLAIHGVPVNEVKMVQRRLKEAILKTSCWYGVPRSLQTLLPLFATLKDDGIDHYGPRWESLGSPDAAQTREEKGRRYFDMIWTPAAAAEANQNRNFKYQPDLYLLNLKYIYEWYFSEDAP